MVAAQLMIRFELNNREAIAVFEAIAGLTLRSLRQQWQSQGERRADDILTKYGSLVAMENVVEHFRDPIELPQPAAEALFGEDGKKTSRHLARSLGIRRKSAQTLMRLLAPIVLAGVARQRSRARDRGLRVDYLELLGTGVRPGSAVVDARKNVATGPLARSFLERLNASLASWRWQSETEASNEGGDA